MTASGSLGHYISGALMSMPPVGQQSIHLLHRVFGPHRCAPGGKSLTDHQVALAIDREENIDVLQVTVGRMTTDSVS